MSTAKDLIANLDRLGDEFLAVIQPLADEQGIRVAQAGFLGKKGKLAELMKELGRLPAADRPLVGAAANKVKQAIEDRVAARLGELADAVARRDLARTVDVTLPARPVGGGHLHVLTQVRLEAVQIFAELGFVVEDGPQIETDWHTFEALAIPTMLTQAPPIRIVAPGHVFRRDDDPTHSPMFTQLEGLAVDEGLSFADLKGVLLHFVKRFFARDLAIRLRPSYFPFVEPGAEVDMQCSFCMGSGCRVCKGTGWVEIGGSGMVDPEVFAHVKIDAEKYTGFAFGMGLERMAMLRHGVNDIKYYYEGDLRFLEQF